MKENTSEELFAKGLDKLYKSDESKEGAAAGSLRRVLLIRDKTSGKGMGYGFAEYHSIADATAALNRAGELGEKCTISSKVVEICFPHVTVFPSIDFPNGGVATAEKWTVVLPWTGNRHWYHYEQYYPSELVVNGQPPGKSTDAARETPAREEQQMHRVRTLETKDKQATTAGTGKKRKAPGASASSAAPAFLQHWQNKAAELRSEDEKVAAEQEQARQMKKSQPPASGVNAISASTPGLDQSQAETNESDQQTFSIDTASKKCCYLCAAQFQTSEGLQRHLRESEKHASNLTVASATEQGYARLKKAGIAEDSTVKLLTRVTASAPAAGVGTGGDGGDDAANEKQYRDRAAERRKEAAQTGTKETVSFSLKPASKSKPPPSASSAEPAKPSYGKGLNMLQKAGWTAGEGLGSGGEGVAAPLDQSVYAAGVGLGHEGSKKGDAVEEAARMTKGDGDGRGGFLEATKRVARERWERMQ